MKTSRRKIWLISFGMVVFMVATIRLWSRHNALRCIDREVDGGLYCEWNVSPGWAGSVLGKGLARYLPGSGISVVKVDYEMREPLKLSIAIKEIGGIQRLSIGQGGAQSVVTFLAGLGDQANLEKLFIFNVDMPDSSCQILNQFGSVQDLAIVPSGYTGEEMPLLPRLETLDLSYSSITDKGLEKIIMLPRLKAVSLSATKITTDGLSKLSFAGRPLEELFISKTDFTDESINLINKQMKQRFPNVKIEISN